eukprot:scaffold39873_cov38-Attheya_sp.AAC.1
MPARPGEIDDLSFTCDPNSRASSAETLATRASNLSAGDWRVVESFLLPHALPWFPSQDCFPAWLPEPPSRQDL